MVAFRRTRATAPGENEDEKENLSTPLMNSERLKDFSQAAYELLVLALLCYIRAHFPHPPLSQLFLRNFVNQNSHILYTKVGNWS
jgi:hypothetical protein